MNILAALANGESHFADTRYYFAEKDTITMETAGTELGRFDASAHLGIGTSGPVTDRLKIQGETNDATKYALRVTNLSGSNLFSVRNDGIISFGASGGANGFRFEGGSVEIVTNTGSHPLIISRLHAERDFQELRIGVTDSEATFHYLNDEAVNKIHFRMQNTDTETGGGANANDNTVLSIVGNSAGVYVGIRQTSPGARLQIDGDTTDSNILRVRAGGTIRFGVHGNGGTSVGSATTPPANGLRVEGDAFKPTGIHWSTSSDLRLKKNVTSLSQALAKLLALRGVAFEWKNPDNNGYYHGRHMGLVAQEVEKVFPEWISEGHDGYKILTVTGFEALVIEALRELNAKCGGLQHRLDGANQQG